MFAQRNYPDILGNPPNPYTIAQIGCFLTAFCNLRTRFGREVNPPTLNDFFRSNGLYLDVGDPGRDGLAWSSINQYDPSIVLTAIGGAYPPPSNNAIVKFIYNGGKTHFSLVNNIMTGTIIDSYDGQVKSWDVYGGVKEWATYQDNLGGGSIAPPGVSDMVADKNNLKYLYLGVYAQDVPDDVLATDGFLGTDFGEAAQQVLDYANKNGIAYWQYKANVEKQIADLKAQLGQPAPKPAPAPQPDPVPAPEPAPNPNPAPQPQPSVPNFKELSLAIGRIIEPIVNFFRRKK